MPRHIVEGPDGKRHVIEAPEGATPDQIMAFVQEQPSSTFDTVKDVAKSAGIGVAQGAIGLATLPGNIEQLGRMGINKVAEWSGAEGPVVDPQSVLPNYDGVKRGIERKFTGEFYKPKTTAGEYARTVGEFAPAAVGGPASWASRAIRVAVPAAASETAGQLTEGTALEPWARLAGALAGGRVANAGQRAVTPLPTDPARQNAVKVLESEGVTSLTAGQKTGRHALRWAESASKDTALSGGKAAQMEARQAEQFTRATLKRAGINADRATPDVMDRAFTSLGSTFDALTARNNLVPTKYFMNRLQKIGDDYAAMTAEPMRAPIVGEVIKVLRDPATRQNGVLPGRLYQQYRSGLGKAAQGLRARDPAAANAIRDVIDVLDRTMEVSIRSFKGNNRGDLGAFQKVRGNYRNLLAIEDAASGAGEAAASGLISPSALRNAVKKQGKRAYVRGKGDFAELARAGELVMKPLPNSGSAPRINAMNLLHSLGGIAGYGAGGIEGAIAGVLAPAIGSRVLMSTPMQRWLANQATAGSAFRNRPTDVAMRGLLAFPGAAEAGLLGDY